MKSYLRIDIILFHLLIFAGAIYLTYHQVYTAPGFHAYASDTSEHIHFLSEYIEGEIYLPHPLWHLSVYSTSRLFHISLQVSAIVISSLFITLWVFLVYLIVHKFLFMYTITLQIFFALCIILIGPLCLPWYNKIIYLGQGSPNIWHNVTLWTVKPFALLSMFFTILNLQTGKKIYYFFASIFFTISLFAKPSFAITFVPAFILFVVLSSKYHNKNTYLTILSFVLMSILILSYQYLHTFNQGGSNVIFDFLGVWNQSSINISYSIIMLLAFPLLFVFLESEILQDDYILLSWIQVFIGILLFSCFAQTGEYYKHGNFGWSYMIAVSLLYLFSIVKFFQIYFILNPVKKYILLSLLIIQTTIGVYYIYHILIGQNPLYIAIFL